GIAVIADSARDRRSTEHQQSIVETTRRAGDVSFSLGSHCSLFSAFPCLLGEVLVFPITAMTALPAMTAMLLRPRHAVRARSNVDCTRLRQGGQVHDGDLSSLGARHVSALAVGRHLNSQRRRAYRNSLHQLSLLHVNRQHLV